MTYTYRILVLALLLTISSSPMLALAQTNDDGSTETRTERRERIDRYRRQSSELQQKMSALSSTAEEVVMIPVLFGVNVNNIYSSFGDPRSGGRLHEGEDIMALRGNPIVSPTPAVVLRTGTGETEGYYVYTANPGGETFVYMHLDRIGEGVTSGTVLPQGGLIGYVGNTGNASGGAAHLHFEIHNSSREPMDPYSRLKGEFSLEQKMTYFETILGQNADSAALAQLMVSNYRSTFIAAQNAGISLPQSVLSAILSTSSSVAARSVATSLPTGDLTIGSRGTGVTDLQNYLIMKNTGPAARAISSATGYFGSLTQAALVEFQLANNISPASGYYGAVTRTHIASNPVSGATPSTPTTQASSASFTRDLNLGKTGEDVRSLQKLLNAQGYTVSLSGAGSAGNETTYFGPATQAALIKFQIAKSISPAVGYFGPITREAVSKL